MNMHERMIAESDLPKPSRNIKQKSMEFRSKSVVATLMGTSRKHQTSNDAAHKD
jgi:hypothetical protein